MSRKIKDVPPFEELFPEQWRDFGNGPLAVQVERFGGINAITQIDIRNENGKLFPDREAVPWLLRAGSGTLGRPLFAPGIRFFVNDRPVAPLQPEIYPFGFVSDAFSMTVLRDAIAFRVKTGKADDFTMALGASHLRAGKFPSLQNQLAAYCASNIRLLPSEMRGEQFDPASPFPA
ncbi:MAG: hypothetical protein MJ016_02910, partial [Victivallaceae bacterium]|nr:hypothetical protein [Victivallaceae bacterium]